jgi:hypothetical protein
VGERLAAPQEGLSSMELNIIKIKIIIITVIIIIT